MPFGSAEAWYHDPEAQLHAYDSVGFDIYTDPSYNLRLSLLRHFTRMNLQWKERFHLVSVVLAGTIDPNMRANFAK
jgi:hypothetical protein